MKVKLLFIILISSILFGCKESKEYLAKNAVRTYLNDKKVHEYTELEWGNLDSVFSPFNLNLSYEITDSRVRTKISGYELTISELQFNPSKNKSRIKILRDSVMLLRDSLHTLHSIYFEKLRAKIPNRLGIPLKLKYITPIGTEKTRRFVFVLNHDESDVSIGHHLNEFGEVCN